MKKQIILCSILCTVILALATCTKDNFKPLNQVPQLPGTHYDYATPPAGVSSFFFSPQENPTTDPGATLGRVLFYDKKLSLNNTVSCASCHKQTLGFSDNKTFSEGFEGRVTTRNAPHLINLFEASAYFWDGRTSTLEELALQPVANHIEMGIENMDKLPAKLATQDYYPPLFEDAFGTQEVTPERISKAMAQFLRSMASYNSKMDRAQNSAEQLTGMEQLGQEIFFSWGQGGCINCHSGRNLAGWGTNFANIGLDEEYADNGFGEQNSESNGMFKVPSLRNIALTAPYMHDGRFATLEEVIEHYSTGIQPHPNLDWSLRQTDFDDIFIEPVITSEDAVVNPIHRNFSDAEKKALVAFLHTLTDEVFVSNPKFSDPFEY